jgi:hypothetical protein
MSDGYKADTGLIRADAKIWKQAAADLKAPKATAESLTLNAADLGLIAVLAGMDDTYSQLRTRIAGLMGGARTSFTNLSSTLSDVATDYDNQEKKGSGHMSDAGKGMGS